MCARTRAAVPQPVFAHWGHRGRAAARGGRGRAAGGCHGGLPTGGRARGGRDGGGGVVVGSDPLAATAAPPQPPVAAAAGPVGQPKWHGGVGSGGRAGAPRSPPHRRPSPAEPVRVDAPCPAPCSLAPFPISPVPQPCLWTGADCAPPPALASQWGAPSLAAPRGCPLPVALCRRRPHRGSAVATALLPAAAGRRGR